MKEDVDGNRTRKDKGETNLGGMEERRKGMDKTRIEVRYLLQGTYLRGKTRQDKASGVFGSCLLGFG